MFVRQWLKIKVKKLYVLLVMEVGPVVQWVCPCLLVPPTMLHLLFESNFYCVCGVAWSCDLLS